VILYCTLLLLRLCFRGLVAVTSPAAPVGLGAKRGRTKHEAVAQQVGGECREAALLSA